MKRPAAMRAFFCLLEYFGVFQGADSHYYRLVTRYTRSSSRVTPASRNFPLSLNTS